MQNFRKIVIFFVYFTVIVKLLESLVIYNHVDALNYHLVLGKYIANGYFYSVYKYVPGALFTGYFDYLYTIPNYIFGSGLVSHATSQFLHFIFGIFSSSIYLFFKIRKSDKTHAYLALLSCLLISKGSSFLLYAKNDGVLSTVFLILFVELYERRNNLGNYKACALFGILFGLCPSIKSNGLIFIFPLVIFYIYKVRNFNKVFLTGVISIAIWLPLLIRNFHFTGNPFFPGLITYFPGNSSQEMINFYHAHMSNPTSFKSLLENLKLLFTGKLFFLILPILVFKNKFRLKYFLIICPFIILMIINGGVAEPRFLFPLYFCFIYIIFTDQIPSKFLPFLLVVILADSKVDKSITRIINMFSDYSNLTSTEIVRKHIPTTKIWDNIMIKNDREVFILTNTFSQSYYAPKNVRIVQTQHSPEAVFLNICNEKFFKEIAKFDYAILDTQNDGQSTCYQSITSSKILFNSGNFNLYEIKK